VIGRLIQSLRVSKNPGIHRQDQGVETGGPTQWVGRSRLRIIIV
jgi:hypothetical protein